MLFSARDDQCLEFPSKSLLKQWENSEQLWKITPKFSLATKCVQMWTANQAVAYRDIPEVWILWRQCSHACHESWRADCSREVMLHHNNRARCRICNYKSCAFSNTRLVIVGPKHQSLFILKCFSFRFSWHLGGNYKAYCNSQKKNFIGTLKWFREREKERERCTLSSSVVRQMFSGLLWTDKSQPIPRRYITYLILPLLCLQWIKKKVSDAVRITWCCVLCSSLSSLLVICISLTSGTQLRICRPPTHRKAPNLSEACLSIITL